MLLVVSPAAWWHTGGVEASEYLAHVHGVTAGDAPHLDLEEEKAVQASVLAAIRAGLVRSAHDVSDGGLAVSLAESAVFSGFGADVALPGTDARLDAVLFGEAQSRVVVSVAPADAEAVQALCAERGAQATPIGTVTDGPVQITVGAERVVDVAVGDLARPYETAIPEAMGELPAAV